MEEKPYKEGTVKLTWISPKDYTTLNSKMFDTRAQAEAYAQELGLGKDYLLFNLAQTDGKAYSWDLMEGGESKNFVNGMKIRDNKFIMASIVVLSAAGAFYLGKLGVEFLKKARA
jgi:hypothetical protein